MTNDGTVQIRQTTAFDDDGARHRAAVSRRVLVRTTAWAVPVVATAVATPLAASSVTTPPTPIDSDIVLSYEGGTSGGTRDISAAVIDWIKEKLLELGPQVPPAPVEPPRPTPTGPEPQRGDFNHLPSWARETAYRLAHEAWQRSNPDYWRWLTTEYPAYAAEYAKWLADNREVIAQRLAWELAVAQLESMMNEVADIGEMLFSVKINYPQELVVTNAGPQPLLPGTVVTVVTAVDSPLINAHLPGAGGVSIIQTGGTATMIHTVTHTVATGEVIFRQPLQYNPAAVTLNIRGTTDEATVTSTLDPFDIDTNPAGNIVSAPIGVRLDVMTGDLQAVLDRWEQLTSQVEDLRRVWDLISQFIDWQDIISGLLPLDQLPQFP